MSSIRVLGISKDDEGDWNKYIYSSHRASFFHLLEWKDMLRQVYGYVPLYQIARHETGDVVGVFPLFAVRSLVFGTSLKSLPFHFLGGPLYDSQEVLAAFWHKAAELANDLRAAYLEIKTSDVYEDADQYSIRVSQVYTSYLVPLSPDYEALLHSFKHNHRYSIRKGERQAKVRFADCMDDMGTFYDLHLLCTRNIGVPSHSAKLFRRLWEVFSDRGMVKVGIATYNDRPIAAILLLLFKDRVLYMWGARDIKYNELCATPLLHWSAIKWGCENGYKYFDFGMTSSRDQDAVFYKSRWSTVPEKVYFYHLFSNKEHEFDYHTSFQTFKNIWQHVPLEVARYVGPLVARQAG